MKAMILAAGLGTRMRPLTDELPKPLLQVGSKSLIEYHIDNLAAAGITDIVINHYHLGEKLEAALGDGSRYGVNIAYSRETVRLETAGGIVKALPLLGTEPFAVISADIWTDYNYANLNSVDGENTLARLVMVKNPQHHQSGDFALTGDGRLTLASESTNAGLTYSGISVMHPKLFANLPEEPLPLRPILNKAIAENLISAQMHEGLWFDIGTPERLAELDSYLREVLS